MSWRKEHRRAERGYHHGNLKEALLQAALDLIAQKGAAGFTFADAARMAGVSPAAPYHHFKDKNDLLEAVAHEGWMQLGADVAKARAEAPNQRAALTNIGVAYVIFARQNPALYRVMYDGMRDRTEMPLHAKESDSGWSQVESAIVAAGGDPDPSELQLATIAAWCAAHGLAEMTSFKEFDGLKESLGGEEAFIRAILDHIGVFIRPGRDKPPIS